MKWTKLVRGGVVGNFYFLLYLKISLQREVFLQSLVTSNLRIFT